MSRPACAVALAALALAACGGEEQGAGTVYPVETRRLTPEGKVIPERAAVTLQLASGPDARVAGYYAALALGYYDGVGLDVAFRSGAPPAQAVAGGDAELGVDWLPALLAARDRGADLVSVAQVFTRAGSVAGGVTPVAGLGGADVLDDGVFARGGWLARPDNRDVAVRFLQASFVGWAYCRERPGACVRILRERRPALDAARQRRRLDAVNALVWPNETGIGTMDPAAFRRTAQVAFERGAVERPAAATAWRDDLALLAVTQGEDEEATDGSGAHVDLRGTYWQPRG